MQLHYTNFGVQLDFNPLIEAWNLTGDFVLQHWAGHPKPGRTWGYLWCRGGGTSQEQSKYLSIAVGNIKITVPPIPIDIDERFHKTLPTAVLFYPNSHLVKQGALWIIQPKA